MAQTVKSLPAMQEARVQSLGQEDPPEKWSSVLPYCHHCSILSSLEKSPRQRNLTGYGQWGQKELDTTERLTLNFLMTKTREN